jgi:uncharacterized membrane protein YjjB (DUF3815 family)
MALTAKSMAETVVNEVAAVEAERPGATAARAAAAGDLCEIWPKAKPILEMLAGIVIFIPGAGATAGAVLRGLIKIGDEIVKETCR